MVPKSLVRLLLCCGFYIVIHSLIPRTLAMKRHSDLDGYLIGDHQRSRRRQNYAEEMNLDENEMFDNIEDVGPPYTKSRSSENINGLPSFIVDYANMIRNDIILLDNSVETRTRKRGNIKVRNVIPDPPCNCEYNKDIIDLGEDYYPRFVENRNCSKEMCYGSYKCQSNVYDLTVLKRRSPLQESPLDLPSDLRHRWIAEKQPVTIGCMCTKNYSVDNRV